MDLAGKFGITFRCRHFSCKCSIVQDAATPIGMGRFMTEGRFADQRKLEISDPTSSQTLGNSYCRIDYQAADVMHWVIPFKCIAGHVINSFSNERFAKFARKAREEIELLVENGRVCGCICEAAINAAAFRSHLIKDSCG